MSKPISNINITENEQKIKVIRRKNTNAQRMLEMLEKNSPTPVPAKDLAIELFGKDGVEQRIKVQRTAKTLRKWGYLVYSFGGAYKFCTSPDDMYCVYERNAKLISGTITSMQQIIQEIKNLGDSKRSEQAKKDFRAELETLSKNF